VAEGAERAARPRAALTGAPRAMARRSGIRLKGPACLRGRPIRAAGSASGIARDPAPGVALRRRHMISVLHGSIDRHVSHAPGFRPRKSEFVIGAMPSARYLSGRRGTHELQQPPPRQFASSSRSAVGVGQARLAGGSHRRRSRRARARWVAGSVAIAGAYRSVRRRSRLVEKVPLAQLERREAHVPDARVHLRRVPSRRA
jgi:hypothetical protein